MRWIQTTFCTVRTYFHQRNRPFLLPHLPIVAQFTWEYHKNKWKPILKICCLAYCWWCLQWHPRQLRDLSNIPFGVVCKIYLLANPGFQVLGLLETANCIPSYHLKIHRQVTRMEPWTHTTPWIGSRSLFHSVSCNSLLCYSPCSHLAFVHASFMILSIILLVVKGYLFIFIQVGWI